MELSQLIELANNGNADAMYSLYEYYDKNGNEEDSTKWLYKAADNNNVEALAFACQRAVFDATVAEIKDDLASVLVFYQKSWDYLTKLSENPNTPGEVFEFVYQQNIHNILKGYAGILLTFDFREKAYTLLNTLSKKVKFTDEENILYALSYFYKNKDSEDASTVVENTKKHFKSLQILETNKDLKLIDNVLCMAYVYLSLAYKGYDSSVTGLNKEQCLERTYNLAVDASNKGGKTAEYGREELAKYKRTLFGTLKYMG